MFRSQRIALGVSQSKLARLTGVPRLRICLAELGDSKLTEDEQNKIRAALRAEADRLQNVAANIDLSQPAPTVVVAQ